MFDILVNLQQASWKPSLFSDQLHNVCSLLQLSDLIRYRQPGLRLIDFTLAGQTLGRMDFPRELLDKVYDKVDP